MGMMGWVRDGEGARANGSWLLYSCCRVVWFHCRTALLLFLDLHDRLSVCVYRTDTRWVFLYMFGYLFCVWRISWVKKNERNDGKHTHSLIFHLAKKDFRHLADYIPNRLILGIGPNARQNMCRVFSATTFDYLLEDRLWTISLFDNNTQYCSKIIHATQSLFFSWIVPRIVTDKIGFAFSTPLTQNIRPRRLPTYTIPMEPSPLYTFLKQFL